MDNFKIDLVAEGASTLKTALEICFAHNAPGGKCSGYSVRKFKLQTKYYNTPTTHHFTNLKDDENGHPTMILTWGGEGEKRNLPFEMDAADAFAFVSSWLKQAGRGSAPDIDGDLGNGFRIFTEDWGHVAGNSSAICAIQAVYAMYGK